MSNSNSDVKKAIAIALTIILVFTGGYFFGVFTQFHLVGSGGEPAEIPSVIQVAGGAASSGGSAAAAPAASTPSSGSDNAAPAASDKGSKSDAAPADSKGDKPADTAPAASDAMTKAEIVDLFKTSANKIKTESGVTVTRNYEDLQHNEEKLEAPAALQSIGKSLISTFLKKDETPVNYTGQEIIDNYPVKGQPYVTNLTENDVTEATCTDDGTYYNITLKFPEETDPTTTGVATSFNIIKADEVYAAASVVKSFNSTYYDAVITCQIEKSTGNMVHATYTLPIVMKVTAGVAFATLDAQVGMTFIDDYSIAY